MSRHRLDSYLRTHRKRWGLSQPELAKLLGVHKDTLSKCELHKRPPTLAMVLKSELPFGVPAHELFPTFYKVLQEDLGAAAAALDARVGGHRDAASLKKLELVESISARTHFIPEA